MIATTKEQSDRLLKCGISEDTADIIRVNKESPVLVISDYKDGKSFYSQNISPAWSLSALIELLPKVMENFEYKVWYAPFCNNPILEVMSSPNIIDGELTIEHYNKNWIIDYESGFCGLLPQSPDLIEAIILTIELLYINGYKCG